MKISQIIEIIFVDKSALCTGSNCISYRIQFGQILYFFFHIENNLTPYVLKTVL